MEKSMAELNHHHGGETNAWRARMVQRITAGILSSSITLFLDTLASHSRSVRGRYG